MVLGKRVVWSNFGIIQKDYEIIHKYRWIIQKYWMFIRVEIDWKIEGMAAANWVSSAILSVNDCPVVGDDGDGAICDLADVINVINALSHYTSDQLLMIILKESECPKMLKQSHLQQRLVEHLNTLHYFIQESSLDRAYRHRPDARGLSRDRKRVVSIQKWVVRIKIRLKFEIVAFGCLLQVLQLFYRQLEM